MTTFVRRKKALLKKNKLLVWFVQSWRLFNNGIGISVNSIELIYILLKVCERFSYYRSTLLYMTNCIYEQYIYSWSLVFSYHLLLRLHLLSITYTFHTFGWSKQEKENGNEKYYFSFNFVKDHGKDRSFTNTGLLSQIVTWMESLSIDTYTTSSYNSLHYSITVKVTTSQLKLDLVLW